MANIVNYTNLFDRLKVLIKYFNKLEERQIDTGADDFPLLYIKNQILSPYESQDLTNEVVSLEAEFDSLIAAIDILKRSIIDWFSIALANVASELGEYNELLPAAVLDTLSAAMEHDSQTLKARELIVNADDVDTDSAIKAHTDNVGTGRLVYTFARPGLSPSEIAHAEVLHCQCNSSSLLGQEGFQLSGERSHTRESHLGQGSGLGPTIVALGASVINGNFEDWTAAAADNWTATVGAWDTEIVQNEDEYEETYCVKTVHAEGDWKITHPMPIVLLPNTMYVVALWVKKEASATGTLRFGISNGDAVDAFVSGCVESLTVADLTTDYVLKFLAFETPAAVDSTWTLGISSDTPAVADLHFDLCQFGEMTVFNSMYFAVCSGDVGFGLADRFGFGSDNVGFEIAEDTNGIIQKFIGRCFGTQLPSTTGAETIEDPA